MYGIYDVDNIWCRCIHHMLSPYIYTIHLHHMLYIYLVITYDVDNIWCRCTWSSGDSIPYMMYIYMIYHHLYIYMMYHRTSTCTSTWCIIMMYVHLHDVSSTCTSTWCIIMIHHVDVHTSSIYMMYHHHHVSSSTSCIIIHDVHHTWCIIIIRW